MPVVLAALIETVQCLGAKGSDMLVQQYTCIGVKLADQLYSTRYDKILTFHFQTMRLNWNISLRRTPYKIFVG